MFSARIAIRLPASFIGSPLRISSTSWSRTCPRAGASSGCRTWDRPPRPFRARGWTGSSTLPSCTCRSRTRREACSLLPSRRVRRDSTEIHDDRFYLTVLLDALVASLPPEAGLLEPAERDLVGVAGGVVRPDEPVLELLGHPDEPGHVARVEVGGQPELGRVGAPDHLLLGIEREDRGPPPPPAAPP